MSSFRTFSCAMCTHWKQLCTNLNGPRPFSCEQNFNPAYMVGCSEYDGPYLLSKKLDVSNFLEIDDLKEKS